MYVCVCVQTYTKYQCIPMPWLTWPYLQRWLLKQIYFFILLKIFQERRQPSSVPLHYAMPGEMQAIAWILANQLLAFL